MRKEKVGYRDKIIGNIYENKKRQNQQIKVSTYITNIYVNLDSPMTRVLGYNIYSLRPRSIDTVEVLVGFGHWSLVFLIKCYDTNSTL